MDLHRLGGKKVHIKNREKRKKISKEEISG